MTHVFNSDFYSMGKSLYYGFRCFLLFISDVEKVPTAMQALWQLESGAETFARESARCIYSASIHVRNYSVV